MSTAIRTWDRYKIRTCHTLHTCAVCEGPINCGEQYYDGGYTRRAHVDCADDIMRAAGIISRKDERLIGRILSRSDGSRERVERRARQEEMSLSAVIIRYGDPHAW